MDPMATELYPTTMLMTTLNGSDENRRYEDPLKLANKIIQTSILAFIMVAMGCVITIDDIKRTCRRPVGVLVGFTSQFVVMPLLTFALAHALQVKAGIAIGMLVIGCSPGGTVSNLFTYWTDGDVCLSIVMTTASVICAFGMMPLNLFIYSRSWTDENSVIPYTDIILTLLSILAPVALGIIIHYKVSKIAPYIEKLGSILGIIGIAVGVVLNALINPSMFTSGWKPWVAAILLPNFGFGFGYILARILRQSHQKCRTIAFETGSQNVALSLTLILLSFDDHPDFKEFMTFPSLYGIFIFVDAVIVAIVYRLYVRFHNKSFSTTTNGDEKESKAVENLSYVSDAKTNDNQVSTYNIIIRDHNVHV